MGFDDCNNYRKWSHDEIQFLKSISAVLTILIKRRDAEQKSQRTLEILQIISDNTDNIIYASTIDDHTVKFVSAALLKVLGKSSKEVIGKKCWEAFQEEQTGPCSFCPIDALLKRQEQGISDSMPWEHHNTKTNKTFLLYGKIIKWVDGQYVHIETGTDITQRIGYEKELERIASTDAMTQIYNREWGSKILIEEFAKPDCAGSLCFLDVDGLKHTNDHFGHDAGDALLKNTINIIRQHITSDDFICRWGGDEFLLKFKKDTVTSEKVIKKIQRAMNTYNRQNKLPYRLSFSYGIVPFTASSGASFDSIVTAADELMYKNKMAKFELNKKRRRSD